jgi:hypothetical protein
MMILIELIRRAPLAYCRWAPIGFRATECYADLRSPVLNREAISNRDTKTIKNVPQPKQNNHHDPVLIESELEG